MAQPTASEAMQRFIDNKTFDQVIALQIKKINRVSNFVTCISPGGGAWVQAQACNGVDLIGTNINDTALVVRIKDNSYYVIGTVSENKGTGLSTEEKLGLFKYSCIDWFAVAAETKYQKNHGLGVQPKIVQVFGRYEAPSLSDFEAAGTGPDYNEQVVPLFVSGGVSYGVTVRNITKTELMLQTYTNVLINRVGDTWYTSGYLKVHLWG